MAAQARAPPGIFRLPNEILSAIFALQDANDETSPSPCTEVYSLRLSCRRFCGLCNHLIVRRSTTVDISRPDTLARLRTVAENPILAAGLHEVHVRLHFYHPWVAASFDNFRSSVISEWQQRRQDWYESDLNSRQRVTFHDILVHLLDQLDVADETQGEVHEMEEEADSANSAPRPIKTLRRAYDVYKKGFEAQDLQLSNGKFEQELAKTLSHLPNVRHLTLHDGDLNNNYDPGTNIRAMDAEDIRAQEETLVKVLSRPMVWEDAHWIMPHDDIWPGVPINLLVNIPLAIGKVDGVIIDYLSIRVSVAPDYTLLDLDTNRLNQLSAAVRAMEVFQFTFQPRCRNGSGPWEVDDQGTPVFITRKLGELHCINQYLGAFLAAKCIHHVEISLHDFWISAGMSIFGAPTSLGAAFSWPLGSKLAYVSLQAVCLVGEELGRLARSLLPESEIDLCEIRLREGTWRDVLDTLRQGLRNPRHVRIRFPLGGDEIDMVGEDDFLFVFNDGESSSGDSQVERFVKGEDIENPLQF